MFSILDRNKRKNTENIKSKKVISEKTYSTENGIVNYHRPAEIVATLYIEDVATATLSTSWGSNGYTLQLLLDNLELDTEDLQPLLCWACAETYFQFPDNDYIYISYSSKHAILISSILSSLGYYFPDDENLNNETLCMEKKFCYREED